MLAEKKDKTGRVVRQGEGGESGDAQGHNGHRKKGTRKRRERDSDGRVEKLKVKEKRDEKGG